MPEDNNIYVDLTPVPGGSSGQNKAYNIYVFKEVFKKVLYAFSKIDKKVSTLSEFKLVAQKLANEASWNRGRPANISSYKLDNDKYFCELTVSEISILRDMVYAHKSKFNGGTIIMAEAELKRDGQVMSLIAKARTKLYQKPLESELSIEDSKRQTKEHIKFLRLINTDFEGRFDTLSENIRNCLDAIEGLISACRVNQAVMDGLPRSNSTGAVVAPLTASSKQLTTEGRIISDFRGDLPDSPQKIFTLPSGAAKFNVQVLKNTRDAYGKMYTNWKHKLGYENIRKPVIKAGLGARQGSPTRIRVAKSIATNISRLDELVAKMSETISNYFEIKDYVDRGWKIVSVLGAGGFGCVVKFLNDKGKERALKLFMDGPGKDPGARAKEEEAIRFMHEEFGHSVDKKPPIKKYFNVPKEVTGGYAKTEKGSSMKLATDVLDANKFVNRGTAVSNISIKTFKNLAKQLLKGLMKIHDAGKVHADIKPGNIHIMKDGSFRIADFGLLDDADKALKGDNHYTHPDWGRKQGVAVAAEAPENKQKNDIYAVGCTLYDVLLGRKADISEYTQIDVGSITGANGELRSGLLARKFSDPSMTINNVRELLEFIKYLCKPSLAAVPTAREALRHSFLG